MIVTPYETFSLRNLNLAKTEEKLKNLYITNYLYQFDKVEEDDKFVVLGLLGDYEDIPVFYQPFTLSLTQKKTAIVVDVRPYSRFLRQEGDKIFTIQANEQVNQLIFNAIFNGIWRDDPVQVVSYSDIPMQVYGSLFADNLSKRLGLDAPTTLNIMATMQVFYTTRAYRNIKNLEEAEKQSIAMSLSRKMKVDLNTHKVILDAMTADDLENLSTVIGFISRQGWSTRLNNLNVKDIYNVLMNGWVGQGNPKETMMVALEFPPTFNSLVYLCARNNFYQKLPLGQIVKRLDRSNSLKNLVVNTMNVLGTEL